MPKSFIKKVTQPKPDLYEIILENDKIITIICDFDHTHEDRCALTEMKITNEDYKRYQHGKSIFLQNSQTYEYGFWSDYYPFEKSRDLAHLAGRPDYSYD